jgi:outer membrane protein assembly factor BamB
MTRLVTIVLLLVSFFTWAQKNKKDISPLVKWTFQIKQPFIGSPVIDGANVYAGGLDSTLYALDLASGKVNWKFKTLGPIRSAVETDDQRVYLNGGDGGIYSLNKQNGKREWVFVTLGGILGERTYDLADYFHSKPVKAGDKVFVGAGDGRLYAIDAATGKLQWSFKANDIVHTTPVIADGKVVFGSSDGFLYALDQSNGNLVWKFKSVGHTNFPAGEMQGSPVISQGRVFIGSRDYNLYSVDLKHGYGHWNKQFPKGWATALTATDSVLFTGTSDDKLFLAFDPKSGRELWKIEAKFNIFGPAVVSGTQVYFGTQMGKLFSADRKTSAVKWIFTTKGYEANRLKYFKEDDTFRDDIYQILGGFTDYLKMLYSLGAMYSTPAVSGNTIVISTSEGLIYCLENI